ncbi:MAG: hypothetical protein JXA33_05540 [Anaerolineae bacterium]|nr:hypothetical protein [Anaerolineae bacterium]
MHWLLTVSEPFSLTQVIRRSRWLIYPPFSIDRALDTLYRVERLTTGNTVAMTVSQAPAGLLIHTHERLNGKETEEVSHKTWRILRLGENLQPFFEIARRIVTSTISTTSGKSPETALNLRYGARLLRGGTLFEDIIKAIIITAVPQKQRIHRISWLVEQLGDPLPSNPTRHAFPTPQQLLTGHSLLGQTFTTHIEQQLIQIATCFHEQEEHIQNLTQAEFPLQLLESSLKELLNLSEDISEHVMGLIMLSLGRYDYIPIDTEAQRHVSNYWYRAEGETSITDSRLSGDEGRIATMNNLPSVGPEEIRAVFEPWQPWGGLAYWLWDWTYPYHPTRYMDTHPVVTHTPASNPIV